MNALIIKEKRGGADASQVVVLHNPGSENWLGCGAWMQSVVLSIESTSAYAYVGTVEKFTKRGITIVNYGWNGTRIAIFYDAQFWSFTEVEQFSVCQSLEND